MGWFGLTERGYKPSSETREKARNKNQKGSQAHCNHRKQEERK